MQIGSPLCDVCVFCVSRGVTDDLVYKVYYQSRGNHQKMTYVLKEDLGHTGTTTTSERVNLNGLPSSDRG
jgi:hypothetical protein